MSAANLAFGLRTSAGERARPDGIDTRRVLYVEGNADGTIGGSYFSLLFLVSGLDRRRFEPVVVFATPNDLLSRFSAANVSTVVYPLPPPLRLRGTLGSLVAKAINFFRGFVSEPIRLARALRREDVALVHLNNSIRRNHTWIIAAALARIPCISHERGINDYFAPRDRYLARKLKAVVCISDAVRKGLIDKGLGGLNLVTIHNGLDPNEIRVTRPPSAIHTEIGVSSEARLIGIVGNIKTWKGQEIVIRAVGQLRDEIPDLACVLIGETPPDAIRYREQLTELVANLGLRDRIVITGYRNDVANYVNALEVLIHASVLPEPFGRVLLEGMALEKPLIASRGGGVPEVVIDGDTGLLFTPGDPNDLARCLRTLLGDSEKRKQFGQAGRRRLETHFSIAQNVEATERLYDSLMRTTRTDAGTRVAG